MNTEMVVSETYTVLPTQRLPEEVRLEISRGNLVRAALIAREKGIPRDQVRQLELSAVREFIEVLRNFEGAKALISTYDLSFQEVQTILRKILENPKANSETMTAFNKKGRMVAMTLAQQIYADPQFRRYL